jgi:hypothetical protein
MQLGPLNKEIFEALRGRNLREVTRLAEQHPELLAAPSGDPEHGDLLSFAAQVGDLPVVRFVFESLQEPDVQVALARACRSPAVKFRPVIEFLLAHGANPRGLYRADYGPVLFVPCENLQPDALRMLIGLGADPSLEFHAPNGCVVTALDTMLRSWVRDPEGMHDCIDVLAESGVPVVDSPVMAVHRGDERALERHIDADPTIVSKRFDVPSANTPLTGATLLHIAAEFCELRIARLLLTRGADINARAGVDADGLGGQTPIFHTVNSIWNRGFRVFKLLIERGADVEVRVDIQHVGTGRKLKEVTPLAYAIEVPRGGAPHPEVVDVLKLVSSG